MLRLALRLFWRDWRGGELGVLLTALVLAVGIVSTLGLFIDRLQRAVELRSATFIAGDRVRQSPRPGPGDWIAAARAAGLREAAVLRFTTMAFRGDAMQLVSVKAVGEGYPLLGRVGIGASPEGPLEERDRGPPAGEVWVDARLLPALGVAIGERIGLGATELRVGAILRKEPDGGGSLVAMGPRLMMNLADIGAAAVVQPGSRVQYAYLFAGEAARVGAWRTRIEGELLPGQRFVTVEEGQPRVSRALGRAESFLMLAGSLGVVLAGIALAMAARRYTERHADYVAILKTLGLTVGAIRGLYAGNLLLLALAGIALGWLCAWVLQAAVFAVLGDLLGMELPAAGVRALWLGAGTGALSLLGLATPPLLAMAGASPLGVLRRERTPAAPRGVVYASGLAALALLLYWYSGDWRLGLLVLGCLLASAALVGSFSYLLLRRARLPGMQAQGMLRLAFAALQRHAALNALQTLVFALSLMLALVMVLVRGALIDDWQRDLPPRTPNHFLVNIAPSQLGRLEEFLAGRGIAHAGLYPMVPGRIAAVNGAPPRVEDGEELNLDREFNLTWSDTLPADNRISAGRWWGAQARDEVSVEAGVARALGLAVGDRLTVQVGAERFDVTLSSIRELDWDTMRPNFFLVFPRAVLEKHAGMWITSFFLEPERKLVLNDLVREFPTVSVMEMDAILAQLRGITAQLALAVELVLALLVIAGALVMVASVQAGLDARFRESAILRALGAGRRLVLGSLIAEFALLGMFAGTLAAAGAETVAWLVQTRLMDLAFRVHPLLWLLGPLAGAVIAALLGVFTCRRVVDTPPVVVLRELA